MTWHFCPSTATHHALANAPTQAHCGARPQTEALLRLPWRGSTGDPPWRSWRRRWRALSRPGSRRLRGPIHARQRHQDRLAHLSGSNQMKQPTQPTGRMNLPSYCHDITVHNAPQTRIGVRGPPGVSSPKMASGGPSWGGPPGASWGLLGPTWGLLGQRHGNGMAMTRQ